MASPRSCGKHVSYLRMRRGKARKHEMSENDGDRFERTEAAQVFGRDERAILRAAACPGPPPPTSPQPPPPELDGQRTKPRRRANALRSGVTTRPLPAVSVCAAAIRPRKARRCSATPFAVRSSSANANGRPPEARAVTPLEFLRDHTITRLLLCHFVTILQKKWLFSPTCVHQKMGL